MVRRHWRQGGGSGAAKLHWMNLSKGILAAFCYHRPAWCFPCKYTCGQKWGMRRGWRNWDLQGASRSSPCGFDSGRYRSSRRWHCMWPWSQWTPTGCLGNCQRPQCWGKAHYPSYAWNLVPGPGKTPSAPPRETPHKSLSTCTEVEARRLTWVEWCPREHQGSVRG